MFFCGMSVPCLLLLYPIPVSVKMLSLYFYLQLRRAGRHSSISWSQAFSFFAALSELKCTCILKVLHKVVIFRVSVVAKIIYYCNLVVFSDSHTEGMKCYWQTSVEDTNWFIVKPVILPKLNHYIFWTERALNMFSLQWFFTNLP